MSGFRRTSRGVHGSFDAMEVGLLSHVARQLLELLTESGPDVHSDDPLAIAVGITSHDTLPEDPVLARLLPNAYENPEHAGEFRRYTEHGLREGKIRRLEELIEGLQEQVLLTPEDAQSWAMAINDMRLALGTRLEVDSDAEERFAALPDDDPEKGAYAVFSWLGWLQQTLIEALGY